MFGCSWIWHTYSVVHSASSIARSYSYLMLWDCRRCFRQVCDKLMLCLLFNCLRVKNKPKKVAVAVTVLTCVWMVSSSYVNQDTTVSSEVFRSFTEGRPGKCWGSNPILTTDVFHIPRSSLFTDIQLSGCVYPEHGLLRRYSWVALFGSSRELTRRIEMFKNLHAKYDRTGCLLRILITLNRPEPELLTTSLNKLQTRKWALGGVMSQELVAGFCVDRAGVLWMDSWDT